MRHTHAFRAQSGAFCFRAGFPPQEAGCQLHRLNDFRITGAAAEVARKSFLDFLNAWVRIFVQQPFGGHNETGRAEPALNCAGEREGFLNQVRIVGGAKALHRDNLRAAQARDFGQA